MHHGTAITAGRQRQQTKPSAWRVRRRSESRLTTRVRFHLTLKYTHINVFPVTLGGCGMGLNLSHTIIFLGDHIPPPTNPTSHLIVEANHPFETAGYCWCALFVMNIIQDSGDNSYSTFHHLVAFLSEVPKLPRIVRCVASSKELGTSCYFIPRFCVVKRSGSYSGAVTFENDPNK